MAKTSYFEDMYWQPYWITSVWPLPRWPSPDCHLIIWRCSANNRCANFSVLVQYVKNVFLSRWTILYAAESITACCYVEMWQGFSADVATICRFSPTFQSPLFVPKQNQPGIYNMPSKHTLENTLWIPDRNIDLDRSLLIKTVYLKE